MMVSFLRNSTAVNMSLASFPEINWEENPSMLAVRVPFATCKSFGPILVPGMVHE